MPTGQYQRKKHHEKTLIKIMIACRLELANLGLTAPSIARHLGISLPSFVRLKSLKEYQQMQSQLLTGILSPLDINLQTSYQFQRKILDSAVPSALENLVAIAAQKVDKKLQFEASKEILDRHGMHAKVSRQGLALPEQGGFATTEDNAIATALMKNLTKARQEQAVQAQINDPDNTKVPGIEANEAPVPTIIDEPLTNKVQ